CIGWRLRLMCGAAAAGSALLGILALVALVSGTAASAGLLAAMIIVAIAAGLASVLSIRFVQDQLIHPVEELCAAMRELAEGNRDALVPHDDSQHDTGAMAPYLGVITVAA